MDTCIKTHLKKGDHVQVLSGKDKGRRGKIVDMIPNEGKAVVEGLNMVKKHTKPSKANPQGGVLEKSSGIPYSRIMFFCSSYNQATRINKQRATDGKLVRVCKRCNSQLD